MVLRVFVSSCYAECGMNPLSLRPQRDRPKRPIDMFPTRLSVFTWNTAARNRPLLGSTGLLFRRGLKSDRCGRLVTSCIATFVSVIWDPVPGSIEIAGGVSHFIKTRCGLQPRTAKVSVFLLLFPPHLRLASDSYIPWSRREFREPAPLGFHPTPVRQVPKNQLVTFDRSVGQYRSAGFVRSALLGGAFIIEGPASALESPGSFPPPEFPRFRLDSSDESVPCGNLPPPSQLHGL